METKQQIVPQLEELMNEDELRIFLKALAYLRHEGFGGIVLTFRQGYVVNVEARLGFNEKDNHRGKH